MEKPEITFELAEETFARGDFMRCEGICERLIGNGDGGAPAHLLKGRTLLRFEGRAANALAAFQHAAGADPASAEARAGMLMALLRLGQIDEAEKLLPESGADEARFAAVIEAARGAAPAEMAEAEGWLLLGQTMNALRRFDAAETALGRALAAGADAAAVGLAMTRTMGGLGRIDDILEACRRIRDACFQARPNPRRYYLGEIMMLCRSLDQVRLDHPLTLAILGGALVEQTATDEEGRGVLNRVHRLAADLPDLFLGAGCATLRGGKIDEAADFLARAAAGMADFREPGEMARLVETMDGGQPIDAGRLAETEPAAVLALGEGLGAGGRYHEAMALLQAAASRTPDIPETHLALASYLSILGRSDKALEASMAACRLAPDEASAFLETASGLMALGRFGEAWDVYDYRLDLWRRDSAIRRFPMPQWQGEALDGRTLMVWREEGIGDELRFASILPDLRGNQQGRIIVECGTRLRSLFERSFADIEFRDEDLDNTDFPGIDFHLPLMSLPRLYRRGLEDFGTGPFIVAHPGRVEKWRERLNALGPQPKVGVGWRSLNRSWRKRPLLTRLADWDPVLARDDLVIVNLQCEDYAEEVAAAEERLGRAIHIVEDVDIKNDMEEAVALMAALDAVIGARCWVPTTAGAVGTKAFCVTPKPNPFMADQDYDPWSPSTDIFYREFDEDWTGVVAAVNDALSAYLAGAGEAADAAAGTGSAT